MAIYVHVACDDAEYRAVIADFLQHQSGMIVVGASTSGEIAEAAVDIADPDVVVLGIPPESSVAKQAPLYREIVREGSAVVAFCMSPEQADEYHELGIERTIFHDEPARRLTAAVRAAYSETGGSHVRH